MNFNCTKTNAFDLVKSNVDSIGKLQETICQKSRKFSDGTNPLMNPSCSERSTSPESYHDSSLHKITSPQSMPTPHDHDIANIPSLISMAHPTSFTNIPRFPNPMTLHEDGYGVGLPTSRVVRRIHFV